MLHVLPLLAALAASPSLSEADSAPPTVQIAWLPDKVDRWVDAIDAASFRHTVDPDLTAIIVLVESGGDPTVVSPTGAVGLMQLMPSTAWREALRRGVKEHETAKLFGPRYNLDFGVGHLRLLIDTFANDGELDDDAIALVAAGYNGGFKQAENLAAGRSLSRETAHYVRKVLRLWRSRSLENAPSN